MNPSTEVLVCTYNGADFIVEQLQSILQQTVKVTKISIYDDGSSDGTLFLIHDFIRRLSAEARSLFAVHKNKVNQGYAMNFANAIANAEADILFLCDQDDIWEPRKVEVILALFQERKIDMAFSDGTLIDRRGERIEGQTVLESYGLNSDKILRFRESSFEFLMRRNYVNGAASAVRRTTAQNALPLPCDMPHDYWLAIWSAMHAGIVAVPDRLYRYRQHQNNVIGIGQNNQLYIWLGIWRHPGRPRRRELRRWVAVAARTETLSDKESLRAIQRKLTWLRRVTENENSVFSRAFNILRSAWDGSYQLYASDQAMMRDILSLVKK